AAHDLVILRLHGDDDRENAGHHDQSEQGAFEDFHEHRCKSLRSWFCVCGSWCCAAQRATWARIVKQVERIEGEENGISKSTAKGDYSPGSTSATLGLSFSASGV